MGGAILSIKAGTQEELSKRVNETIQQADHKGLSDLRGIEFFAPGKFVKPNGKPEDQWVAVIWVHS
jgi:hypothetical protein